MHLFTDQFKNLVRNIFNVLNASSLRTQTNFPNTFLALIHIFQSLDIGTLKNALGTYRTSVLLKKLYVILLISHLK